MKFFNWFSKKSKQDSISKLEKVFDIGESKHIPLTKESFVKVKTEIENVYNERISLNKEILESKLKSAKLWTIMILEELKSFDKRQIDTIHTYEDPKNDLESIISPRVFIEIRGHDINEKLEVFSAEHKLSRDSIIRLYEFIRTLKKTSEVDIKHDSLKIDQADIQKTIDNENRKI